MQTNLKKHYLNAMGIETWQLRTATVPPAITIPHQSYSLINKAGQVSGQLLLQSWEASTQDEKINALLDAMLSAIGFTKSENPVSPSRVLVMGLALARDILKNQAELDDLRSQSLLDPIHQVPLIVTYHPIALLKDPTAKPKAWADLKKFQLTS